VAKTITKEEPSFAQYVHLNSTYSSTLSCPCSKISINYEKFIRVDYTLHQLCNSIFVNQSWIDYLTPPSGIEFFVPDFRWMNQYTFPTLKRFCDVMNTTISNSLIRFYSNKYVSASVNPQQLFEREIEILVDQFRSSMKNTFSLSLSLIRDTTQANALYSGLITNYDLHIAGDNIHVYMRRAFYRGCECVISSKCISPSSIYGDSTKKPLFNVPGFYIGCYVIEASLQSTLECFYDQECIDQLQYYIFWSPSINPRVLNASLSSVYSMNSTIGNLIDNLMIEEWNVSTIYETYYNECRPTQCTYKLETKNDIIYIITTLFGIVGGLITVLKVVVPRLVKLVVYYIRKQRARVVPEILAVQT
jgi:hypothetical protein